MMDESRPHVILAFNAEQLLRNVVIMVAIMAGLGSQLACWVTQDYMARLSASLAISLWCYYLARVLSSCHASVLVVRGREIEVFDLMGKRLGSFPSEKAAIGPPKRVRGGLQVPLLLNGWAKVRLLLSADDELRLRRLIAPTRHERPSVPYIAVALVIPLAITANVWLVAEAVKVHQCVVTLEGVVALVASNAALLVALVRIRLGARVSLRTIVRRIL